MISINAIHTGLRVAKKMAIRYLPQLLTGGGICLMAAATAHAVKTSPEAAKEVEEINQDPTIQRPVVEKTLVYAKHYWPTLLMTFGGAGMIIGGQHVSLKRFGLAMTALSMEKDKRQKLEEKIAEKFGPKKLLEAKDEILQDEVRKEVSSKPFNLSAVYNTGRGTTLCYDPIGKRFYLSDLDYIRKMWGLFNMDIAEHMKRGNNAVMSLNDWYDYIDLPKLDGRIGKEGKERVGPNIGKDFGWRNRLMDLQFTAGALDNGQTYSVIGFTESGGPKADLDISDDYGSPYSGDDETDMPWRGR